MTYTRWHEKAHAMCLALCAVLVGLFLQVTGSAPGAAESGTTIRAVMHSPLRITDPLLTTAYITRNHGYMIYDTLLGLDENFEVRPQMADWTVSDDRLTYTFTLRDGLEWHDGEPVTASDCVASISRWAMRDGMGQLLLENTERLEATDDSTITLTLKEPMSFVLHALAKLSSYPAFMMPERVAGTPPSQAITEHVGSGPFQFQVDEFQPGVRAVYVRNEDYVPRPEPASWTAGGKVVEVERVEWLVMPDPQTQINALLTGEIDMIEDTPFDLLPLLDEHADIAIKSTDPLGFHIAGRMNFLHPPFDRVDIRRAAMLALNQEDFLHTLVGDPKYYRQCGAMFVCGGPYETDAGASAVLERTMADAKQTLRAADYDGTPVVVLQPTDVGVLKTHPVVAAQLLREAGFAVDTHPADWQTVVSRRASQNPPAEGGWNLFFTIWSGSDLVNPLANPNLIGRGKDGAWFGWPDDATLEQLRGDYARAATAERRKTIAHELQVHAYDQVIYLPLGQFARQTSWRKELDGVTESPIPLFWGIRKP